MKLAAIVDITVAQLNFMLELQLANYKNFDDDFNKY